MVKVMSQARTIRWSIGISLVMSVSLCWSLSPAGTIGDGRSAIGAPVSHTLTSSAPTVMDAGAGPTPPAAVPVEHGLILRSVPTVSTQISVKGTTLVPYIGAGFGGGYLTEFDRSLNPAQSPSIGSFNVGSKNLLGQQLIPNELQLGVRFPF